MGAAGTPVPVSVMPNSGSGARDTLTLQYSDMAGAASLQQVWVYFDNVLANPASNACLLYYAAANHQISLRNDASAALLLATPWAATAP